MKYIIFLFGIHISLFSFKLKNTWLTSNLLKEDHSKMHSTNTVNYTKNKISLKTKIWM